MENNHIDLIQYIRHIVNNCNKAKWNILELIGYKQDAVAKITDTLGLLDEQMDHLNDTICVFRKDIESKNVELENFSLQTFVKDTVARLKAIAEDDRIDLKSNFQANIKDSIIGDSFRIRAVLSQLVGSAIIHGTKCTTINICVHLLPSQDGKTDSKDKILQFVVQSIGPSIQKEKLQKINSELSNSNLTKHQELGQGLVFIKQLTHQMKGNLKIDQGSNYISSSFEVPIQLYT
ncbi:sensor histidine kinase [Orientia tsutsugamushi]|uniref:Histidine kinase-, DNA gyrase B-, and HSP90-like ATPase family protein n=2 Tax=Orientia tsutsugamushi TaxID=784 RepID=A0A0F3NXM4_ORITS|nr:ATP-binding protein [Orientia tsutsugamushi]KJV72546.1 histidine kinase-, DNA gyrase B-, and HSP90-like ATPase family protein [Orientia tsutsugamushi str. TA716]SPR11096.1 histidine kinase [Orientia tsutsugamushi]